MAKIYLDTNYFIDLFTKRGKDATEKLNQLQVYISPLSYHILRYVYKLKIPNQKLINSLKHINIISLSKSLLSKALEGPTKDLEDNLQLHSAAKANCKYFLTQDQKLINMKFFGRTRMLKQLPS